MVKELGANVINTLLGDTGLQLYSGREEEETSSVMSVFWGFKGELQQSN